MGANVVILRVKHDASRASMLKEADGFGHEAYADPLPAGGWMDGDAHEVAVISIQRVELVADDIAVEFRDDEIGMCGGNIKK